MMFAKFSVFLEFDFGVHLSVQLSVQLLVEHKTSS